MLRTKSSLAELNIPGSEDVEAVQQQRSCARRARGIDTRGGASHDGDASMMLKPALIAASSPVHHRDCWLTAVQPAALPMNTPPISEENAPPSLRLLSVETHLVQMPTQGEAAAAAVCTPWRTDL